MHDESEMTTFRSRIIGDSEALYKARSVLYSKDERVSNEELEETIHVLRLMVAKNDPAAMHQLGQVLWEGLVVDKNLKEAAVLFENAISLKHPPALVSLGAMRHAYGLSYEDYERAADCYNSYLEWLQKEETRLGSEALFYARNVVHIGEVGLNEREFLSRFGITINDISYLASTPVLRKINDWRLAAKRRVASIQRGVFERNPKKNAHINLRRLPLSPLNGFCVTATLAGDQCLTHLGLSLGWAGSVTQLWIPLTDFGIREKELPSLQAIKKFNCPYGCLSDSAANKIRASIDAPSSFSLMKEIAKLWDHLSDRHPTALADYKLRIELSTGFEGGFCTLNYGGRLMSVSN